MELSVQDLEQLLSSFSNSTNSQFIQEADQILFQWKQNVETLPTALEIIQSSTNKDLITIACGKVKYNFDKNNLDEEFEAIKLIFDVCIERIISNRSFNNLPEHVLFLIFEITAISTYYAPQLLDLFLNSNQFSSEEQTCYFAYLLNELSSKDFYQSDEQNQLHNFFCTNISDIFALLRQCAGENISHSWVLLHCSLPKFLESYEDLLEFVEFIEIALNDDSNVSTILNFFDYILQSEDSNDYPYFIQLITIMVHYANSAFSDPSDLKVNAAYFIWDKTIDLTFEFFGFDQISDSELFEPDFINFVFGSFLENLPNFLVYELEDESEEFSNYFYLLKICASCLEYQPHKVSLDFMMPYITNTLDFIINQIDFVSELSLPRNDRLYPYCLYCDKMDECLTKLMRLDSEQTIKDQKYYKNEKLEEDFNTFTQYISIYFNSKIGNLTNGVLYAISFAPKKTRLFFSSGIGLLIKDQPDLVTFIYFIEKCCKFTPEVQKEELDLTFAIVELEDSAPLLYEVSKALVSLSKYCPQLFFEDGDDYIEAMLEMIDKAPIDLFLSNLFISTFNTLFCLQERFQAEEADEETIQNIEELFDRARTLFEEKIPFNAQLNDVMNMRLFGRLIIPIIEKSKNKDDLMSPYYESLYDNIEKALSPLMLNDDEDFQDEICQPIDTALDKHWVANKEPYFQWIEEMVSHTDIFLPIHLSILSHLVEFLPSQKFTEFFALMENFGDGEMLKEVINVLINVIKYNPEALESLVTMDQLLYPLESTSSDTIEKEFKLIKVFINNIEPDISQDDANKIALMIAQKAFLKELMTIDPDQSIKIMRRAIKLLRIMGFKYDILENTLGYILDSIEQDSPITSEFAESYLQGNEEQFKIALDKLARLILNPFM